MNVHEIKVIIDEAPVEEQLLLASYLYRKFSSDSTTLLADQLAAAQKRIDARKFVTLEKAFELHQKLEAWEAE